MGKAFGQMFHSEIEDVLKLFYGYYIGQLEKILEKKMPKFMAEKLSAGVESLAHKILDLNIHITKKYTNPRYYQ